jgi:myosin heavy subunit
VLAQEVYDALPEQGVEDMTSLEQLSEDLLLANLKIRFDNKLIYVSAISGSFLCFFFIIY